MRAVGLLLLVAVACASELSMSDLKRANKPRVTHGSLVAGKSKKGVFEAINAFMDDSTAAHLMRDCELFTLEELDATAASLLQWRNGLLSEIYEKKRDNRFAFDFSAKSAEQHTAHYNMTRDAKCAQILMVWAHHVPESSRLSVEHEGMPLPRMPRGGPLEAGDATYTQAVQCTDCHYPGPSGDGAAAPREEKEKKVSALTDPPRWGGDNETRAFFVVVNMTNPADAPAHPNWQFRYWYDDTRRSAFYAHEAGQGDETCVPYIPYPEPCNATFAADGWVYLKSASKCCKRSVNAGSVVSTWLQKPVNNPTSFVSFTTVRGLAVGEWRQQGHSWNHYYATVNDATYKNYAPVRFMEYKHDALKQWDFLLETYKPGPQDASWFAPPPDCDRVCV
ncbi:hypothetical protein DIPPA_04402 [Diplonema papillatum]|nr:hypothetical protein DIPPA_04438 [Diplonema papillatum]KAJ9468213.1 hypothetical protein DIPPA_04402 [Diplonema papillatum]|eukprot:gene1394-2141_t